MAIITCVITNDKDGHILVKCDADEDIFNNYTERKVDIIITRDELSEETLETILFSKLLRECQFRVNTLNKSYEFNPATNQLIELTLSSYKTELKKRKRKNAK